MPETEEIIAKVALVKDGFKPIRDLAGEALASRSEDETLTLAHELYRSDVHQARMMATILFGRLAPARAEAFTFLRDVVSHDPDWRTQEMLAMAFDTYCKGIGYEQALPAIESWLGDSNPNVRRAVSEGRQVTRNDDHTLRVADQHVAGEDRHPSAGDRHIEVDGMLRAEPDRGRPAGGEDRERLLGDLRVVPHCPIRDQTHRTPHP
jgi:hypothetical protein